MPLASAEDRLWHVLNIGYTRKIFSWYDAISYNIFNSAVAYVQVYLYVDCFVNAINAKCVLVKWAIWNPVNNVNFYIF